MCSSDATACAAAKLAPHLTSGDTILLQGEVGAGKTHFARSIIQCLLVTPEDVPSPTFTLVQTYDTKSGPVWHADLYRLGATDEIEELGLDDAFAAAICLVEWPDRLGPATPVSALTLTFEDGPSEDTRVLCAQWDDKRWADKLECWAR